MSFVFYHRTTSAAAYTILREGFRDGTGTYLAERQFSGIWLSQTPFDANDGVWGDTLLEVTIDLAADVLADLEWVEEGKQRREWLVPAVLLNPNCRVRIVEE
jgi:hypothetical protein